MKHLLLFALLAGTAWAVHAEDIVFGVPPHHITFKTDGEYPTVTVGGKEWVMIPKDIWDRKNAREIAWEKEMKIRLDVLKNAVKESEDPTK